MENQDRYEAIFRLALIHAKAVAKTIVGGGSVGMRAALSYVGMVATQYSRVTGKEFDVRYTIFRGDSGIRLRLYDTAVIRRPTAISDELPANGSCRQVYQESSLHELFQQNQEPEISPEDGPCLQL